ncbi:MAG: AAA family ATPase [Oscillospiraceae bacterium]|nr:AAA family ATPase [Oscillospiraceae bacterium]
MGELIKKWEDEQHEKWAKQYGFHPIQLMSARELQEMDIPPLKWRVERILPVGVCGFAAKSKSFKSFACLDLCISVATGSEFLGFRTQQCDCVYMDLESGKRRPRDRINAILQGQQAPENLFIMTLDDAVDKIGAGFEKQVSYILEEHPDVGLIVVDVFTKIRQQRGANRDAYSVDYSDIGVLTKIAHANDICIVFVTHFTKGCHDDVFDNMIGSAGTMGSLDTAWVIEKEKRSDMDATLHIQGRDVEPQEIAISFNTDYMKWENVGTPEEIEYRERVKAYMNENIFRAIKQAVHECGSGYEASASEIRQYGLLHNLPIWQEPQKIGNIINDSADLLESDGITFELKRTSKGRKYIFSCHQCHS